MRTRERAIQVLTVTAVSGVVSVLAACARHEPDAVTQARIFGCLDVADARRHGRKGADDSDFRLEGLGCADLDPAAVRAAVPAWRAQQAAAKRAHVAPPSRSPTT